MNAFKYCPRCGGEGLEWSEGKRWTCHHCGFVYYHNIAAAVVAVLLFQDEILLTERKQNPAEGMLDLPGGFVNHHESLEQALTRELKEELNVAVAENDWHYLFSFTNRYDFAGIPYYTSDAFFLKEMEFKPEIVPDDDVADATWIKIKNVTLERIGLESIRLAVGRLQGSWKC
jgi:ADP-ribose pyrophosphatase YjhB (NUDIX family)